MPTKANEGEELVSLTEIARLLPGVTRPILAKYVAVYDLLPWHTRPDKKPGRKYYSLNEVKRVLRALEPLRAKEIPRKYLRAELERLPWYKEMRSRESAGAAPDFPANTVGNE